MNIGNKSTFYNEIYRVLKSGGQFVFHDIFQGLDEPLQYPVPWAENETMSFLARATDMRLIMEQNLLAKSQWIERTNESIAFFEEVLKKASTAGPSTIGIHLLMGDNSIEKLKNYLDNLKKGLVKVFMGLACKQGTA